MVDASQFIADDASIIPNVSLGQLIKDHGPLPVSRLSEAPGHLATVLPPRYIWRRIPCESLWSRKNAFSRNHSLRCYCFQKQGSGR